MKTAKEVLSEVTGIPLYRLDDNGGEFISKSGALSAMETYASQCVEELDSTKWIPVQERLPENLNYIVFTDGKDIALGYYIEKDKEWVDSEEILDNHVTHWMPLPDKPNQ